MRILLVSMPGSVDFIDAHMRFPNLAIASIAGSLPGHEVKLMDLVTLKPKVKEPLLHLLANFRPQLVGLSAMTFQFSSLLRVAALVKEFDHAIKIVAGGYHATLMHRELDENELAKNLDFLVRGEGEETVAEFVEQLNSLNPNYSGVLGLSYRNNGTWEHNNSRPLMDLAKLPLPRRDLRVTAGYHFMRHSGDVVETSRGCPFNCKFCSITHMYGHTFRPFPIGRVIEDIANAKRLGANHIFFSDDNLTYDAQHFKDLCKAIVDNGHNDVTYITQVSAVGIAKNPELVEYMDKANFRIVFVGFESMDPQVLKNMNKPSNPEINLKAAELLKAHDMGVIVGTIVGYPDDDCESVQRQIYLTQQINGDGLYLQYLTPYPKTRIREEMLELGLVENEDDFDQYTGMACNTRTKHLSHAELKSCKRRASFRINAGVRRNGLRNNYFYKNYKDHYFKTILKSAVRDVYYMLFDRKVPFKEYDI